MKVECPHCRQGYEVDEAYRGQFVECESCGKGFEADNVSAPSQQKTNPNLFACPDCGVQISKKAQTCPHCGTPITSVRKPTSLLFSLILWPLLAALALFFGKSNGLPVAGFCAFLTAVFVAIEVARNKDKKRIGSPVIWFLAVWLLFIPSYAYYMFQRRELGLKNWLWFGGIISLSMIFFIFR